MDKQLLDYVREQARNKINPNVLKHNLINRGWSKKDAEQAIKEGYAQQSSSFIVTAVLVLIVGFLVLLVVSLYSKPIGPEPVSGSIIPSSSNDHVSMKDSTGCSDIVSSIEKDRCYLDKLDEGLNCDSLNLESEKNFCFRALEYRLLNS